MGKSENGERMRRNSQNRAKLKKIIICKINNQNNKRKFFDISVKLLIPILT